MEGGALRESAQIPQEFMTALCCPLISDHREPRYQIFSTLSLSIGSGGKKSGFSQPWECFSCQSGKLNELVMERKMPHFLKPRLNSGCLIVSNYSMTLSHPGCNCPVREPNWLATQARCREGQLLVKLDPKLNTEKPMSFG